MKNGAKKKYELPSATKIFVKFEMLCYESEDISNS